MPRIDIDFQILNILRNATSPLTVEDIASLLAKKAPYWLIDEAQVCKSLETNAFQLASQDSDGRWRIMGKTFKHKVDATMQNNDSNQWRDILSKDPPPFLDRVNTPWDQVPDFKEYNQHAYNRIVRALEQLKRSQNAQSEPNSQGILILGEAGTGKTHLLMRVARNLSGTNHILFVRKPNNEEAVFQHIWANIVSSLARYLPDRNRNQLDDLLAHVFSKVLIPEFEQDIREDKDAEQKQRWVNRLTSDPFNLFSMLGDGEQRQANMERIRRRTLRYLQDKHPNIDQQIAKVLITYCFVVTEDRKRLLMSWLSGQDIDDVEANAIGLPTSWAAFDETSTDTAIQQQREEQALRAITTIGVLSTYYQPLILAFDQLEGLRDHQRLTERWGDAVREIFTTTPNFLVITCIFPSLWESWFQPELDRSASERISQQRVELDKFASNHGLRMLAVHLEPSFIKLRLPTSIYPFTENDVQALCQSATSPRSFIQLARSQFESWLDGEAPILTKGEEAEPRVVATEEIDGLIASTMDAFEKEQLTSYDGDIPLEQDFFGRVKNVVEAVLWFSETKTAFGKSTYGTKVMPSNMIVKGGNSDDICIAVANGNATAFAARMRNLNTVMKSVADWKYAILLRDSRCRQLGARGREYVEAFEEMGGTFIYMDRNESAYLNAIYDTIVSIEEHDLSIGSTEIDKRHFVEHLKSHGLYRRSQFLKSACTRAKCFMQAIGSTSQPTTLPRVEPSLPEGQRPHLSETKTETSKVQEPEKTSSQPMQAKPIFDIVIGDDSLNCLNAGVIGRLTDDNQTVGLSFCKPLCTVILGYMGSGKSYALGVLIENALVSVPGITCQTRPMSVVAFNYRRNPEARFEYWGYRQPNSQTEEVRRLRDEYGVGPNGIGDIKVLGYEPELRIRKEEYRGVPTLPIQFKSDELSAEHWEILMKPPSPQTEYMDIVRDVIQKLYYQERLTFANLEKSILADERFSESQRRRAMNRMSFAAKWITDSRDYSWSDVLTSGSFNIFDLRMQTMTGSDALKLCLVITDLVRRTRNGINKMIVFDEAHEYVDSKELLGELENAITQIRHDGLSFVLASQFPERIPEHIFKYLLTRIIFKIPSVKAINYIRKAAPNLDCLSPKSVSNLSLEKGACFIQTDDECSDPQLKKPQLLTIRPRCSQHGGYTLRIEPEPDDIVERYEKEAEQQIEENTVDQEDQEQDGAAQEDELCPRCGQTLVLRRGPVGPFIGCSGYPQCRYSQSLPR